MGSKQNYSKTLVYSLISVQFIELTHQARVPLQTTFVSTHESFPANRSPAYATSFAHFSFLPKHLPNQPYVLWLNAFCSNCETRLRLGLGTDKKHCAAAMSSGVPPPLPLHSILIVSISSQTIYIYHPSRMLYNVVEGCTQQMQLLRLHLLRATAKKISNNSKPHVRYWHVYHCLSHAASTCAATAAVTDLD